MKAVLLVILLSLPMAAMAQPAGPGKQPSVQKPSTEQRVQRMQQNLGLSDEQASQIRDILEKGGGREQIRAVLTEEQIARAKELRGQKKRFGKRGGSGGEGAGKRDVETGAKDE